MKKLFVLISLIAITALLLSACGTGKSADLLADIKKRGYILISTDPNYAPQSFLNTEAERPADTKCPSDALTAGEMQGFDVDVAKALGDFLGVETCFATPDWDTITAGSWADKWDISVGSMANTPTRGEVLDFSVPYYYPATAFAVAADSGITSVDQLAGQALCVGGATTYESWLTGTLDSLPEYIFMQPPANVTIIPLPTDQECAQAIAAGRRDFIGYVTSETVIDANLAEGMPVIKLDGVAFVDPNSAACDKGSTLNTATLLAEVNKLFTQMHADGTLSTLSVQWFGIDLTKLPGQ